MRYSSAMSNDSGNVTRGDVAIPETCRAPGPVSRPGRRADLGRQRALAAAAGRRAAGPAGCRGGRPPRGRPLDGTPPAVRAAPAGLRDAGPAQRRLPSRPGPQRDRHGGDQPDRHPADRPADPGATAGPDGGDDRARGSRGDDDPLRRLRREPAIGPGRQPHRPRPARPCLGGRQGHAREAAGQRAAAALPRRGAGARNAGRDPLPAGPGVRARPDQGAGVRAQLGGDGRGRLRGRGRAARHDGLPDSPRSASPRRAPGWAASRASARCPRQCCTPRT